MRILIDSREQTPFHFSPDIVTERVTLRVGDYSLRGLEDEIVIERKSLSDLLGSITADRDRFVKELRQLRSYRFAAIVVEADWRDILNRTYQQDVHPNTVIGSLMSFAVKFGVLPILAEDHDTAARLTERLLMNFARGIERDCAALRKTEVESSRQSVQ